MYQLKSCLRKQIGNYFERTKCSEMYCAPNTIKYSDQSTTRTVLRVMCCLYDFNKWLIREHINLVQLLIITLYVLFMYKIVFNMFSLLC